MHNAGNDAAWGPFCVLHLLHEYCKRQQILFSLDFARCPVALVGWDIEWVSLPEPKDGTTESKNFPKQKLTEAGITILHVPKLSGLTWEIATWKMFKLQQSMHIVISEMPTISTSCSREC